MRSGREVPEGKLRRGRAVASTTVRAGLKKLRYVAKKPFLSDSEQDRQGRRNDEEIARSIFETLSRLRGAALKAAQMTAMEMEMIPEVYRREMMKTAYQVRPINKALIRTIISRELGAPPEKVFQSFEPEPFAAASLGQVHRAMSPCGEELAVKVQYPGMAESVTSDMAMLKAILRPSRYYRIFEGCFEEIQVRMAEELDYTVEARNTAWFKEHLGLESVVIPKVYPEYSTSRVLTTQYIHGCHLDEWLAAQPPQDAKDRYGQLLVDLFHHTLFDRRMIHADPNIGNYIFMDDGGLGLIDFGCVKKVDQGLSRALNITRETGFEKDPEKLKDFYRHFGIHFRHDFDNPALMDFIDRWVDWVLRPEREESFEFHEGSEYFNEGQALLKEFYRYVDFFGGESIYFGRSYYGLRRLLQKIGVTVDLRPPSGDPR